MNLEERLASDAYSGYAYGYPHKTAYRSLTPPVALADVWAREAKDALTLYVHVPTCEMRCGFCNLFTATGTDSAFEFDYVAALERQAERVFAAVPDARFAAAAVGGGTPTHLSAAALARVVELMVRRGASPCTVPTSVETSPRTADDARLDVLARANVRRISIGVQSFREDETRALGRPQRREWVEDALARIKKRGFPVLNVDLIYGMPGQAPEHFLESIELALVYAPEQFYLYPLYVRPLTALGKRGARATDSRVLAYRAGRDLLLARGYRQVSMRFFQRRELAEGADNCCQEDGTIGLGCGARSYTRELHYAFEWAVGNRHVRDILSAYLRAEAQVFERAHHGVWLSPEEQRRRYVLKTLLRVPGLPLAQYRARFGSDAREDVSALKALIDAGLAHATDDTISLSARGLELSDAIGPFLYSNEVRARMASHEIS